MWAAVCVSESTLSLLILSRALVRRVAQEKKKKGLGGLDGVIKVHVGCVHVSAKAKLCLLVWVWEVIHSTNPRETNHAKMKTSARKQ